MKSKWRELAWRYVTRTGIYRYEPEGCTEPGDTLSQVTVESLLPIPMTDKARRVRYNGQQSLKALLSYTNHLHEPLDRGNMGITRAEWDRQPTSLSSQTESHRRSKVAPMGSQQSRPQTPKIQFRVLIIGRANAGKTAILQRVCETTESPIIYRGKEQVRGTTDFNCLEILSHCRTG